MKFEVVYVKIDPDGTEIVKTETVTVTGELYHRLDQNVMLRKVKEKINWRLGNSQIKEVISISTIFEDN